MFCVFSRNLPAQSHVLFGLNQPPFGIRVKQYVTLGHMFAKNIEFYRVCDVFKQNSTQLRAQSPLLFDLNNPHHQLETQSPLLFDWKTPRDQLYTRTS